MSAVETATVTVDGINYNLTIDENSYDSSYAVVAENQNVSGTVNIKSFVQYNGIDYCVSSIASRAFYNCAEITEITLPQFLNKIGVSSFEGCTGLHILVVPEYVYSIGRNAFKGCHLEELVIKSSKMGVYYNEYPENKYEFMATIDAGTDIYAPLSVLPSDYNYFYGRYCLLPLEAPYIVTDFTPLSHGAKFKLDKNKYYEGTAQTAHLYYSYRYDGNKKILYPDEDGMYTIGNLMSDIQYSILVEWEESGKNKRYIRPFNILEQLVRCYANRTEQTGFSVFFYNIVKGDIRYVSECVSKLGIDVYDGDYRCVGEYYYSGSDIIVTGLNPNTRYLLAPFIIDNNNKKTYCYDSSNAQTILTRSLGLKVDYDVSPTSVVLKGSYTDGDANVVKSYFEKKVSTDKYGDQYKYEVIHEGDILTISGLIPERYYWFRYTVETDAGYTTSEEVNVVPPAVELNMLQPMCVSGTSAIVAAETNITDMEANVGFQWKKYDSPASLVPKEGYAVIYDGRLEGRIDNLQSSFYYNVRAFFKDANETYYYSDWVTFDPSDFSYFEPTVHTYPVQNVGSSNAVLRGYALAGTDDIVHQGFQYRPVEGVDAKSYSRASDGYITVYASGRVMTIEVDNLTPGTTYEYRSFVETASGYTYGEEFTFTTEESAEIDSVECNYQEPEIIGYYDLSGRRYEAPQRGFNIVLYSDGSTRKIMVL